MDVLGRDADAGSGEVCGEDLAEVVAGQTALLGACLAESDAMAAAPSGEDDFVWS